LGAFNVQNLALPELKELKTTRCNKHNSLRVFPAPKNVKITIYSHNFVLNGCETWYLTLGKEAVETVSAEDIKA
jgi:hypothetical protein